MQGAGATAAPANGEGRTVAAADPARTSADAVPAAQSHLATYTDSRRGVSFQYPDVWRAGAGQSSYLGGQVPPSFQPPKASFVFSPAGNVYEKTLLTSLSFSYYAKSSTDEASCVQQIASSGALNSRQSRTVNGTSYVEMTGGDAGMCHQQTSQVDVTYHAGECLVFERDFNTECYGAGDGKRRLTDTEIKALQRHLDEVMQSVTIAQ